MPAKRAQSASTKGGGIRKSKASPKTRPSTTQQQKLLQDVKSSKRTKPNTKVPAIESPRKMLDPVTVLPLEVVGLVLEMRYRFEESMRAVIALERVSKGWASAIRATCTPVWCQSKGSNWCSMSEELVEGKAGWDSIKAEVKRHYNMKLGFPTAGIAGDWAGATLLRENYFACLQHERYGPNTLMIRRKDPKKAEEGLPIHEQFGEANYFEWRDILDFRGRPISGELYDEELWNITFFGSSTESIILLLEHVTWPTMAPAFTVGEIHGGKPEKIIACISTESGHLLWVRPVDPKAAKFALPVSANRNTTSINDFIRIPSSQELTEKREVLKRRRYWNNVPHSTTNFFSYITCTSTGVDYGVELTDSRLPITVNTLDLRTGEILDNLRHTIPDAFYFCWIGAVVKSLNVHLPAVRSSEPDHLKLLIHQSVSDLSWNASIHNLATRTQLTTITLPRPSFEHSVNLRYPESIPTGSFRTTFDVADFRVSIYPAINNPSRYTIFATAERAKRQTPFRNHQPNSSLHISWTLTLDLSEPSSPILCVKEVNYFYAKDFPFVRLNPRSRIGATTRGPKYDRTTVVSIISYLELQLQEGSDDVILGETSCKLRCWVGHRTEPKPLMLLSPVPPKRKTKKALMREEEIANIAKTQGWEAAERSSREVFRAAYLDDGILDVRDGVLVLKGTVFWF